MLCILFIRETVIYQRSCIIYSCSYFINDNISSKPASYINIVTSARQAHSKI